MKVLMFDRLGKFVKEFESVDDARANSGCKNVIRSLFREATQTNGYIFAFEKDERIDEEGNLNVIDYFVQYDPSGLIQIGTYKTLEECPDQEMAVARYLPLDKKFDSRPYRVECWFGKKKIGVFDSVGEARKVTGSPCIWANIFGECKTTNEFVFKKEELPF